MREETKSLRVEGKGGTDLESSGRQNPQWLVSGNAR